MPITLSHQLWTRLNLTLLFALNQPKQKHNAGFIDAASLGKFKVRHGSSATIKQL
jgi:hypothetical protein